MEAGGLAAIVMGREDVSRVSRYQEPHCPFLAETGSNQTWSSSYMLATALARHAWPPLPGQGPGQVRSHTGWGSHPLSPQVYQPQTACSLSPEKQGQDPSICRAVFWAPSAPYRQGATQRGRGLHLPGGGKETDLLSQKHPTSHSAPGNPRVIKETQTLTSKL